MNVQFACLTTTACTLAFGIAFVSVPEPALGSGPALSVTDRRHELADHGEGQYTVELGASGTIAYKGSTSNTAIQLRCEVDDPAETLRCTGALRVNGVAAPIRLSASAGTARFAISNGFSALHMVAWEQWFELEIADLVPPFDPGDDAGDDDNGDDNGGDDGGWNPPGDIIIIEDQWTVRDYASDDWLLIVDGVVANALCW